MDGAWPGLWRGRLLLAWALGEANICISSLALMKKSHFFWLAGSNEAGGQNFWAGLGSKAGGLAGSEIGFPELGVVPWSSLRSAQSSSSR